MRGAAASGRLGSGRLVVFEGAEWVATSTRVAALAAQRVALAMGDLLADLTLLLACDPAVGAGPVAARLPETFRAIAGS